MESGTLLERVSRAVEESDGEELERSAHKLKGAVMCLATAEVTRTAQHLENMGRERNLENAGEVLARPETTHGGAGSRVVAVEAGRMSRILVADDDLLSRKLLGSLLTKWGYEPEVVDNGVDARRVLGEDDAPRLAILDWMMPDSTACRW